MYAGLYSDKRAAQAAAYFIHRANGTINALKLTKLLYLAERCSYARYGEPLTGDMAVSMEHGPVLSITYDHTKGKRSLVDGAWPQWVSHRANNNVNLVKVIRDLETDLPQLSHADIEVLAETWGKFGHMGEWTLVDWTHDNCAEWTDPGKSSAPIPTQSLLKAIGYSDQEAVAIIEHLKQEAKLNETFAAAF